MTRAATGHLHRVLAELADTGQSPACTREPDLWVSDDATDRDIAVHRCAGCRVITECAAAAKEIHPAFGVWAAHDRTKQTRRRSV
jgi:Transcription factor WhiB